MNSNLATLRFADKGEPRENENVKIKFVSLGCYLNRFVREEFCFLFWLRMLQMWYLLDLNSSWKLLMCMKNMHNQQCMPVSLKWPNLRLFGSTCYIAYVLRLEEREVSKYPRCRNILILYDSVLYPQILRVFEELATRHSIYYCFDQTDDGEWKTNYP